MSVLDALVAIQQQLKSPKDQNAGRYKYRNIEDINEAVKPLAAQYGVAIVYSDEVVDGKCISKCTIMGKEGGISSFGVSYINTNPKNMSIEQACGAASSYARKYAACGLFAIDSSENDPDRTNAAPKQTQKRALKPQKADTGADALGAAQKRITAVCKRYAELQGIPTAEWYELNIRTRADYANDAETLNRIASELEASI